MARAILQYRNMDSVAAFAQFCPIRGLNSISHLVYSAEKLCQEQTSVSKKKANCSSEGVEELRISWKLVVDTYFPDEIRYN